MGPSATALTQMRQVFAHDASHLLDGAVGGVVEVGCLHCGRAAYGVFNEVVSIRFDINGHVENSFCYVAPKSGYDLILGKPWMRKNEVQYHPDPERLWIQSSRIEVENVFGKKERPKLDCMQISSAGFYMQSEKEKV